MKKTCIKILSVVLCTVMVLGATPLGGLVGLDLPSLFDFKAEAATYRGTCGTNLTWSLDTSTGVLNITGTGTMKNYVFSSAPWFSYRSNIKTVNIASGVTSIGNYAFKDCDNLTSVTIGNGVTSTGFYAFDDCDSLKSVTIGNSVTTIDAYSFSRCNSLKSITIPDGVTTICFGAFYYCDNLKSITIPDSVTTINESAFYYSNSITNVYYKGTEAEWNAIAIDSHNENLTRATIHYNYTHNYSLSITKEPTCTETGIRTFTCECKKSFTEPIPKLEHDIIIDQAVAPTCSKTGLTQGQHCSRCDDMTVEQEVVPALNHKDTLVKVEAKAPTCTEIGWDAYEYCTACTYTTYAEKAALEHDIIIDEAVESTCAETGLTEGQHCSRCDDMTVKQEVVPALNHKDTLVKVTAKAPTCTEIGWDAYEYCTACDYTTYAEKAALEHDIVIDKAVEPDCTETGLTEGQHCSRCDDMTVEQEIVPALNHKDTLVKVTAKAPTCTEIGWDAYEYCTACDYTTYAEKAALEHDIVIDKAVEPDCTETGLTEGQHCSRCDDMIVEQEIVPVKPHSYTTKYDSAKHWEECVCGSKINVQNHSFVGGNICSCGFKRTVNLTIKINNNGGSKTINYGENLKLMATVTDKPANAKIYWYVDGEKKGEGEIFDVKFESGTKIITVKLVDENGVVYQNANGEEISESENVTVKAGFFQKLISFFKNLFRMNRTVVQ